MLRACHRSSFLVSVFQRRAIHSKNGSINAFVAIADNAPTPNNITVGVKSNICTSELTTTCSSGILKDFVSPFNATVVDLLQASGVQVIGKTNCDEFGMGSLNVNSIHGPVVNPFQHPSSDTPWETRERRSAGGSSGGSAAAVAAGLCDVALGTDTGGSVRLPAAYCGVVGLKPSYGLLSRWGIVPYADSLDCVGILAKDVALTQKVFDILNVHDPQDPTSVPSSARNEGPTELRNLRVGVPQEYFPAELSFSVIDATKRTLKDLKAQGVTIVPISLRSTSYALSAYYVIASAEASSNMARYDGIQYGTRVPPPTGSDLSKVSDVYSYTRTEAFGSEVKKRILLGTYSLSADAFDNYFLQAQRVRQLVKEDFDRAFHHVDVLIHPSAIRTAPLLESVNYGLDSYVQDVLTVPASLAGLPAVSIPVRHAEDGWPVGVSVVGQWGADELVMKVGQLIESIQ
ncbi:amidase signature enzyme [Hymenopellis radicata]|nr:amidase signature enzyme [Hymenopellis radicata]